MAWFEERGIELKIEDDGRVFPTSDSSTSDSSASIANCLLDEIRKYNIKVYTNQKVKFMIYNQETYY